MRKLFDKLFKESPDVLNEILEANVVDQKKTFVVTANPEVFMKASEHELLSTMLLDDQVIITPDGEGIVMAAKKLGYKIWGKIAGVDTVEKMFDLGNSHHSKLYIYGSKQEVLDQLQERLNTRYENLQVVGLKNGYTNNADEVFKDMVAKEPDIILVALGVPKQEMLIASHLSEFKKGIFIGCGGSLDVLSGSKKRAPKIFIKLKIEWLYRICKEPKRIKRFYESNVKFLFMINKMKKVKSC